jgi:hypothetical protein
LPLSFASRIPQSTLVAADFGRMLCRQLMAVLRVPHARAHLFGIAFVYLLLENNRNSPCDSHVVFRTQIFANENFCECWGDHAMDGHEEHRIVKPTTQARQGVNGHNVRSVLSLSVVATVEIFAGLWIYYFA